MVEVAIDRGPVVALTRALHAMEPVGRTHFVHAGVQHVVDRRVVEVCGILGAVVEVACFVAVGIEGILGRQRGVPLGLGGHAVGIRTIVPAVVSAMVILHVVLSLAILHVHVTAVLRYVRVVAEIFDVGVGQRLRTHVRSGKRVNDFEGRLEVLDKVLLIITNVRHHLFLLGAVFFYRRAILDVHTQVT